MNNPNFTKKLQELYTQAPIELNKDEDKVLEEGILAQVRDLFSLTDENTSQYQALVDNLIRLKLDDIKLLRGLANNLSKTEGILSKIPAMAKDATSKKVIEERLKEQRDNIRQKIEKLQDDMDQIKIEAKETAKMIKNAVQVKAVEKPEDQNAGDQATFKEWLDR